MLLSHFKFSFKEDKLNFRFIGTLRKFNKFDTTGKFIGIQFALYKLIQQHKVNKLD